MSKKHLQRRFYPSAKQVAEAEKTLEAAKHIPPSLRLAFTDTNFLVSEDLRGVRLMLEYIKAESILTKKGIEQTIVIFGSARLCDPKVAAARLTSAEDLLKHDPDNPVKQQAVRTAKSISQKSHYYTQACKLGNLIGEHYKTAKESSMRFYVATGGGPGIMEAANCGASEAGVENIGFTIAIPREFPNVYSSADLTFQFHYFGIRKMHLLLRARALIIFPGGYGTLDELFETLTLIQTNRLKRIPVLLFGRDFWERIIHFKGMVDEGMISPEDLESFIYVETAEEAWEHIVKTYDLFS